MYHNSHYSFHNPGGCVSFSGFSFSFRFVENISFGDERLGYNVHGDKRGDIGGENGDDRGDISGDVGISVLGSQDTSHYYFQNCVQTVDSEKIGESRSQTNHSSSHNLCDLGRLFCLYVDYRCVHKIVYGNEGGDIFSDDGMYIFRFKETSRYYFHNHG